MLSNRQLTTETVLLTSSIFLERFAYYGTRSILTLYLLHSAVQMNKGEASELFGLFTAVLMLSRVFGGLISDLVLGTKWAAIIGGSLQTIGFGLLTISIKEFVYTGLVVIVIGNALYIPSVYARIGRSFLSRPEKLDASFSLTYFAVNLGAFMAPLIIGAIGEGISYQIGFGASAIAMLFSTLLTIFLSDKEPSSAETAAPAKAPEVRILISIGITSAIMLFWVFYEFSSFKMYTFFSTNRALYSLGSAISTGSLSIVICLLLSILLTVTWFFWKVNSMLKVGFGFLAASLGFYMLNVTIHASDNAIVLLLLVSITLIAIGELLIPALFYSIITKYAPPKFLATIIGATSIFVGYLTNMICVYLPWTFPSTRASSFPVIGALIVGAIILILFFATGSFRKPTKKLPE